jgi:DNA-binding NtrC family response regulator
MPKATAKRQKASAKPRFPDAASRRPTLLLVDAEAPLRMTLSGFLQDCGFKVFESASAGETVHMLEESEIKIDLVLADVTLPGEMDGFGLATWIRANRPEVLVLLAAGDANKAERAEQLCAEEPFFAKPYDLQRVVKTLRRALRKRESG